MGIRFVDSDVAHDGRNTHRLHVPHRPAGRDPGPDGGELHPEKAEVHARLHHRRPGDLQHWSGRRGAAGAEGGGSHSQPRRRQPAAVGLLVADCEDPARHANRLHPVAAASQGSGVRQPDESCRQRDHQADGGGRPLRLVVRQCRGARLRHELPAESEVQDYRGLQEGPRR